MSSPESGDRRLLARLRVTRERLRRPAWVVDDQLVTATLSFQVLTLGDLSPVLAAHAAIRSWSTSDPLPAGPGVYVWTAREDQAVLYVGSAASLARRIANERRWVRGYEPETKWAVTVVHLLKQFDASAHWLATDTHADALLLERCLIEWHRACVGTAPLAVGWDAKPDSATAASRDWARGLWNELYG